MRHSRVPSNAPRQLSAADGNRRTAQSPTGSEKSLLKNIFGTRFFTRTEIIAAEPPKSPLARQSNASGRLFASAGP
jgi:hypothetical protein